MIRALRPTDLLPYLAFRSQSPGNEALRQGVSQSDRLSLRGFLGGSLSLDYGRETWVQIEGGSIDGLIAARSRYGADVWDVDRLMVNQSADTEKVSLHLIEHLCGAALDEGVQKVFVRLAEGSEALYAARQAGFHCYSTECLFVRPAGKPLPVESVPGLRNRRLVDHQSIFQLYCLEVPAYVRQVEGLTLHEWRSSDGWWSPPVQWRRSGRRDLIVHSEGRVSGWLRVMAHDRAIRLLVDSRDRQPTLGLISIGLRLLGQGPEVVVLVPEYQTDLRTRLEEEGFNLIARHALLVRLMAIRVPEAKLIPLRA